MQEAIPQQENSPFAPQIISQSTSQSDSQSASQSAFQSALQAKTIGDDLEAKLLMDVTPTDKFLVKYLTTLNQKKFSCQELSLNELSQDHSSYSFHPFEACGEKLKELGRSAFLDYYHICPEDAETLDRHFIFADELYTYGDHEEFFSNLEDMFNSIELFSCEPLPVNLKFNPALSQGLIRSLFQNIDLPLAGSAYRINLGKEQCLFLFRLKSGEAVHYELYLQEEMPLKLESSCFASHYYCKSIVPICSSDNPHVRQLLADLYFKLYKSKRKPELSQELMTELNRSFKYL